MTLRQHIGSAFTSATCANLPDMGERARNRRLENPGPPSTSIEKALAVLSALNGPLHSRSISDLADEVGLPRPTLHRILKQLADATVRASQKVSFETANANAGRAADFVVLGDNAQLVSRNASKILEDTREAGVQFLSLSSSFSRALADMKAVYFITVQRWAWNESQDSPPVHTYTYPRREIPGDAFDYFNALPESLPSAGPSQ